MIYLEIHAQEVFFVRVGMQEGKKKNRVNPCFNLILKQISLLHQAQPAKNGSGVVQCSFLNHLRMTNGTAVVELALEYKF